MDFTIIYYHFTTQRKKANYSTFLLKTRTITRPLMPFMLFFFSKNNPIPYRLFIRHIPSLLRILCHTCRSVTRHFRNLYLEQVRTHTNCNKSWNPG